ncbi:MAG: carbohydrate ABC transporter permease [Clostridiales bacterium]|jgi:ABC-type glycerol-3-phosphate transport system permease component|nr:carbohydrate ABC transporter permease [Clostridiales bacterium]
MIQKKFSVGKTVVFVAMAAVCASYILLMLWAFLSSLKGSVEFIGDKVGLPRHWLFSNYAKAWRTLRAGGKGVPTMIFNALWYSCGVIVVSTASTVCFAYVMARFKFPGAKVINVVNIFVMMVPILGSLPSLMRIVLGLGLYDSPLFLLTSVSGMGGGLIIYRTAFRNVPWEFAEAAYIDGAGHFRTFLTVMLPQIVPIIVALSITSLIGVWNDYTTPILFLPSYQNMASGLYVYQIENARTLDTPLLFAGCLMCAAPMLAIFAFGQKYMMEINLSGGLKG